jgi:hypothetical protein
MSQVPLDLVSDSGPEVSWQASQLPDRARGQDDLEAHSGYNLARTLLKREGAGRAA